MSIFTARLPLETPCVDICAIDASSGLCSGCGRTIEEIANWASMSPEQRRAVMAALPARRESADEAKG
jgi:predicted Fe-S protein YdhL (DUF1289 family)